MIFVQLAAVILLLATNAFFVLAEFAAVSARSFRLDALAMAGGGSARMAVRIKNDVEVYLAACQLGITMASLGLGWIGEPAVAALLGPVLEPILPNEASLHTVSFIIGFVVFSSLHIVVGEQVPKTFAIRQAESIFVRIAIPLRLSFIVLFPLTWVLNWASASILRGFGVEQATHGEVMSDMEIRGIIDESAKHGEMTVRRAEMLDNLFTFDDRPVSRVMIPLIEADILRLEDGPSENREVIKKTQHSRYPVIRDDADHVVGILLTKDLITALIDGDDQWWQQIETKVRPPLVVPETMKVGGLMATMRKDRAQMACVIDEYGSLVGLVTLEDLLEEIVGEMFDELDRIEPDFPIRAADEGFEAHGLASLSDLHRALPTGDFDNVNANTVSGLIALCLQHIPEVGDIVEFSGFEFTVVSVKDRHAEWVRIKALEPDAAAEADDAGLVDDGTTDAGDHEPRD